MASVLGKLVSGTLQVAAGVSVAILFVAAMEQIEKKIILRRRVS